MTTVRLKRRIDAPAEVVFDTITDHRRYPEFTPIRRVELEREGDQAPNGVGAIRALYLVGPPIREGVLAYERPRLFRYEVLSGVPVRSQIGTVTVEPSGIGSEMRYELEIEPPLPLIGPAVGLGVRVAIGRLMSGVAKEAERRTGQA